jgi:hypothetical protein
LETTERERKLAMNNHRIKQLSIVQTWHRSILALGLIVLIAGNLPVGHSQTCSSGKSDLFPGTPNYVSSQGYLQAAPNGVDAGYAWTFTGGSGFGVKMIDANGAYNFNHEDLPTPFYPPDAAASTNQHETAEIGIVAAINNGYGMTGIANLACVGYARPDCGITACDGATRCDYSGAIREATEQLRPGDVIWIPSQTSSCLEPDLPAPSTSLCGVIKSTTSAKELDKIPVEWRQEAFDAISEATAKGIIVVEAAGNRARNLDDPRYLRRFDRSSRDSGAIIVGSAQTQLMTPQDLSRCSLLAAQPLAPLPSSNYGSRVDVQGWGSRVAATGSGDWPNLAPSAFLPPLAPVGATDQYYLGGFGGTSAATGIVAGVVACIQGFLKAIGRPPLSPAEMRDLLVATGTPQKDIDWDGNGTVDPRHIGPQPNLRAAINALHKTSIAVGYFDDDSFQDMAIGIPYATVNRVVGAGKVLVLKGTATGLDTMSPITFTQETPGVISPAEMGDHFGFSLAVGDFDNNGRDDLAIGVPFEDVDGNILNAGAVNVIYSDDNGLNPSFKSQFFHQNSLDVPNTAEEGDSFGYSLAAGDFDNNGRDDLAIGVPDEDLLVGGVPLNSAGMVNVIYSDASGLNPSFRAREFNQNNPVDIGGVVEAGDRFGYSLGAGDFDGDGRCDLAVGAPFENVNGNPQAGAVDIVYSRIGGLDGTFKPGLLHQDIDNVPGTAEAGDLFGYALAVGDFDGNGREDLAVGVPSEDLNNIVDSGLVNVVYSDATGLTTTNALYPVQEFHQNSPSVPDQAEIGDRFGESLAAGDFDNSRINFTRDDLAIGAPGEDVTAGTASVLDAGAVVVIYSSQAAGRLSPSFRTNLFHQNNPTEIPSEAGPGDRFGSALAVGRFDDSGGAQTEDLAIGVWGEPLANGKPCAGYTLILYGAGFTGLAVDNNDEYLGIP